MPFRGNLLLGGEVAGPVGGAGGWLEAARVLAGDGDYVRLSAGLDYGAGRHYGFAEYHFNGAGAGSSGRYAALAGDGAYREGAVFLLGRHYLAPAWAFQATPLLHLGAQLLLNLGDGSALLAPRLEYGLGEDVFAETGAFLGRSSGRARGARRIRALSGPALRRAAGLFLIALGRGVGYIPVIGNG